MSTWKRGRMMLTNILQAGSLPLDLFLKDVEKRKPPRVPGTAVFMTSTSDGVPVVLLHHLKHNKVLHETVVILSVMTRGVPEVPAERGLTLEKLGHGFVRVVATFGFMQSPNIPEVLARAAAQGVPIPPMDTSYYLGRERLVLTGHAKMHRWRKQLFALMSRNARSATEFFQIPPNRVVELGAQIEF
jgi:KUP system potassium uptake protein